MIRPKAFVALCGVLVVAAVPPSVASAWAPAGQATVHPGVQVFTEGAQCTVQLRLRGRRRRSTSARPRTAREPAGRPKPTAAAAARCRSARPVEGDRRQQTRHARLQLVADDAGKRRDRSRHLRLQRPRADRGSTRPTSAKVNPSVPGFGGPTGVGTVGGLGSTVYSYGNSELRGGITKLSPKQGVVVQNEGGGWSHNVVTLTPGHPRRLGQRLPQRVGRRVRRAQHPAAGAARRLQRRRRPGQGARLHASPRGFTGLAAGAGHRAVQSRTWPEAILGVLAVQLGEQALQVERGACTSRPSALAAGLGHSSRGRSQ